MLEQWEAWWYSGLTVGAILALPIGVALGMAVHWEPPPVPWRGDRSKRGGPC